MKFNRLIASLILLVTVLGTATACSWFQDDPDTEPEKEVESTLLLNYSLDEFSGSLTKESVSGTDYTINYVFNEQNADSLFKEPNDPLRRPGVKGNALYMDAPALSAGTQPPNYQRRQINQQQLS